MTAYDPKTYTDGVIFDEPAPYLQVALDGTQTVVYLPDPTRRYVVRVEGWLGDTTLTPTLTNGWQLTALNAGTTNSTTWQSIMGTLAGAKGLMGGALLPHPSATLAPGLYRIDLEHQELVGPLK